MRVTAPLIVTSALLLAGCASVPFLGGGRERPAPPPGTETAGPAGETAPGAPAPARTGQARRAPTAPDGSPDEIDPNANPPPPERRGFLANLARRLGQDSTTPNVGPCPPVRVLYDASRFVDLAGPERFENVGFTGEINGTESTCRYVGTDPIAIQLTMDMAFGKGPRAQGASREVTYWVAVTQVVRTTDPVSGQVRTTDIGPLAKQRFVQRVTFPAGADRMALRSPVTEVTIPRRTGVISGANFEVLVGFELTPEQLQFNRDGKRFRIDAGAPR